MAQLKDTTVTGNLRVTGEALVNDLKIFSNKTATYVFAAPSAANGIPSWRALTATDLPTATTGAKGIVQIGTGLGVNSGTVSVTYGTAAGAALATSGSAGSANSAARSDHVHPFPTAAQVGAATSGHNHNTVYLTAVGYDSNNKKIYYTKNGSNTDVVEVSTLKTALNFTASDLGLSNAMHFIGLTTTNIAYNYANATESTTNPITVDSNSVTAVSGDVVLYDHEEYVWNGSKWLLLGDETEYKRKQTAFTNSPGSADGTNTSNTFIYSFSQTANGNIQDIKTRKLPEGSTSTKGIVLLGTTNGAATYGHTHTLSIATDTGTNALTFAANTKYKLTAGGNTYIFTTQNDAGKLNQTSLGATAALSSFTDTSSLIYTAKGGGNTVTDKPTGVDAFGVLSFKTADGWYGQLLMSSNTSSGLYWRTGTSLSADWKILLDNNNFNTYLDPSYKIEIIRL